MNRIQVRRKGPMIQGAAIRTEYRSQPWRSRVSQKASQNAVQMRDMTSQNLLITGASPQSLQRRTTVYQCTTPGTSAIDVSGHRFGMLVAIRRVGLHRRGWVWFCKCDCGNETEVIVADLRRGNTKSCGCHKGTVRTVSEIKDWLFEKRIINDRGCWEWTGVKDKDGYGLTGSAVLGKRSVRVPRLAAHLWLGFDLYSDLMVCHHCDNPACFNPDHLFPGTAKDNWDDCFRKKRHKHGPMSTTKKGEA